MKLDQYLIENHFEMPEWLFIGNHGNEVHISDPELVVGVFLLPKPVWKGNLHEGEFEGHKTILGCTYKGEFYPMCHCIVKEETVKI